MGASIQLLKRCEDASKNDDGWLVSGLDEWVTDRPTNRRTDTPSYRDARTHLKMMMGGW